MRCGLKQVSFPSYAPLGWRHDLANTIAERATRLVYRFNTYPVIHLGFFHAFLNVLALTPLLERFEAEHGTLTALLLFFGRTYSVIRAGVIPLEAYMSGTNFLRHLSALDLSRWIVCFY